LAAFLGASLLPLVCVWVGRKVLERTLESARWPLANPMWQMAAAYATVAASAILFGVFVHGLAFSAGTPLAGVVRCAPFVLGALLLYPGEWRPWWRRLARPLSVRGLAIVVGVVAAAWLLWGSTQLRTLSSWEGYRAVLLGAPCLLLGFAIMSRRRLGLRGLWEDERPFLLVGLWLPVEIVSLAAASAAPALSLAAEAAQAALAGLLAGAIGQAGVSFYETQICAGRIRARWIDNL